MSSNKDILKILRDKSDLYFPLNVNAYLVTKAFHPEGDLISSLQNQCQMRYYTWITDDGQDVYTVYNVKLDFLSN